MVNYFRKVSSQNGTKSSFAQTIQVYLPAITAISQEIWNHLNCVPRKWGKKKHPAVNIRTQIWAHVMSNQYQSQFQSYCNWIQHTSNTISHNLANSIAIRIANGKVSGITNYIAISIPNGIPDCIVNDIANAIANVIAKP